MIRTSCCASKKAGQIVGDRPVGWSPVGVLRHWQEAFDIGAQLPWHRRPPTAVMVEIAFDEELLKPPLRRAVVHNYGEPFKAEVLVYSLEEIVAEKLRAILQHVRQLEQRG